MRKRIGNDIRFTWHVNRRVDGALVPESFIGKDVAVELIAPSHRAAEITDVRTAAGVVTFTFPGKNQTEFGVYTAVLYENRGNDGMVAIDTVEAVTLVRHSFQESNEGSDVIEASSVEIDSELSASAGSSTEPVQADWQQTDDMALDYIKNKPDIDALLEGKYDKEELVAIYRYGVRVDNHQTPDSTLLLGGGVTFFNDQLGNVQGTIFLNGDYLSLRDRARGFTVAGKKIATEVELEDKADKLDLAALVNTGAYNSTSKKIELKHDDTVLAEIDATAFIKDGMVDSVTAENGYLVITFNTDAGKEPVRLALTSIFNPDNYYTKSQVNGLLNSVESKTSIEAVASGTTAIVATEHKYYVVQGTVGNLAVTLPTPEDPTKVQSIAFYFTTGANPSVTFSHASTVYYYDGYAIEASKTYEINALWNGTNWIIAYGKIG